MTVFNFADASEHLGSSRDIAATASQGLLNAYQTFGPDRRSIYLETDPDGLPSLREHVQSHTKWRH